MSLSTIKRRLICRLSGFTKAKGEHPPRRKQPERQRRSKNDDRFKEYQRLKKNQRSS